MAVVLCDGASASLKALTWAAVPGLFLQQHEDEELILVHFWLKDYNATPAVPKELIDGIPAMLEDPAVVGRLPPSAVVHRTLESITESKATRDLLNYKIETMGLMEHPPSPVTSPMSITRKRSTMHREKEKDLVSPPPPVDTAVGEEEALHIRAAAVAQYAHERAVHHRVASLVLGAGNRADGKSVVVGHVAAATLRTQRELHPLWFVKSGGTTLRSTTPVLRYVLVLLPPGHGDEEEKENKDSKEGEENKKGEENKEGEENKKGEDNKEGEASKEDKKDGENKENEEGEENKDDKDNEDHQEDKENRDEKAYKARLERDARAIAYAASKCRAGTDDAVTTVIVADPTAEAVAVEQYASAIAALLPQAPVAKQSEEGEEREQTETGEEGAETLWPPVSVCTLRATKHLPSPTAATGAAQVVKFLQQRKIDVVVVPAAAPEPLQLALLGMSKPHVLVLPSNIRCQEKEVYMAESLAVDPRHGHCPDSFASHDKAGGLRQQFLMETPALVLIPRRRVYETKGHANKAQAAPFPEAQGHSNGTNNALASTATAHHVETSALGDGVKGRVHTVLQREAVRSVSESLDSATHFPTRKQTPQLSLPHSHARQRSASGSAQTSSCAPVESPVHFPGGVSRRRNNWVSSVREKPISRNQSPLHSRRQHQQKQLQQVPGALSMRLTDLQRPRAAGVSLRSKAHGSRRSHVPRKVICLALCKYQLLRVVAGELGFTAQELEEDLERNTFNVVWSDTVLPLTRLVRLANWQRTNHFPSMHLLCRKGHLGITLGRMRKLLPSHFNYYPRTWSLRSERYKFMRFLTAVRARKLVRFFIMKPNSGSQGRGIVITRDPLNAVEELDNYIAQEYITRPLLLEERKFDLRVYVLLTSIREPSIFLFNDGLVRMCAEKYDKPTEHNSSNNCKHLTNYALNKHNPEYVFNADVESGHLGNKRNFRFLNAWLRESSETSPEVFWEQVSHIICKTILVAQPQIASVYNSCFPRHNEGYNCFEVLGFDILVDSNMKPWLMEVNHTPSLATDTPLDYDVKHTLITEVLDILDIRPTDRMRGEELERERYVQHVLRHSPSGHTSSFSGTHTRASSSNHSYTMHASHLEHLRTAVDHAPRSPSMSTSSLLPSPALSTATPCESCDTVVDISARRAREDAKLHNFSRIYPTQNEEHRLVYEAVLSQARTLCSASNASCSNTLDSSTPHVPDDRPRCQERTSNLTPAPTEGTEAPTPCVPHSSAAEAECPPAVPAAPSALRERAERLQRLREDIAQKGHLTHNGRSRTRVWPVISAVTQRRAAPETVNIAQPATPVGKSGEDTVPVESSGVRMDALRNLQEMLDLDASCERSPSRDGENNSEGEGSFVLGE